MKLSCFGLMLVLGVAVVGCQNKAQVQATAPEVKPYQPLSEMDTASTKTDDPYAGDPYAKDPYATDPLVKQSEPRTETTASRPPTPAKTSKATKPTSVAKSQDATTGAAGTRTHTVAKGDTFYKLARQYYGDASKWKIIWEANKIRVPDPAKLEVGTKLIIP